MDRYFGNWLAGFVDGEGCFTIQSRNGGRTFTPAFAICLRDDDGSILEEIRRRTGIGRIYYYTCDKKDGYGLRYRVEWRLFKKADLLRFITVLDICPLRAKKARDYAVWRLAVLEWAARKGHRGKGLRMPHPIQERLAAYKKQMEDGRAYGN